MHKDQHRLFTFNMPFTKQSYKVNSFNCLIKQLNKTFYLNGENEELEHASI